MDLAKEFFGRTVNTAVRTKTCVSCKGKTGKDYFRSLKDYQEYLEDGLCQICNDELNSLVIQ
jgi:hypothetical protein